MTADPLAYLHAAHAAAEKAAEAATPGPWAPEDPLLSDVVTSALLGRVADCSVGTGYRPQSIPDAAHIAANDPATVLRRIAADRKLIHRHQPVHDRTGWSNGEYDTVNPACATCGSEDSAVPWPCDTIRDLATGWGWTEEGTDDDAPA